MAFIPQLHLRRASPLRDVPPKMESGIIGERAAAVTRISAAHAPSVDTPPHATYDKRATGPRGPDT